MSLTISSLKNPRIKNLIALQKPRERRLQGRFVVEGIREVSLAQSSGYTIETVYVCDSIYRRDSDYHIDLDTPECIYIDAEVYAKIAYRDGNGGVLAEVSTRTNSLENLPKVENPLYLILDQVEKPGNIGAMMRTADAAGLSGVIVCDAQTDLYNPNLIRASIGTIFTLPVAVAAHEELLHWLQKKGISIYAAALSASKPYHAVDYTVPSAVLLGSESHGLGDHWLQAASANVVIPMRGKIDSMNVSNAAAIILFEAVRQRTAKMIV